MKIKLNIDDKSLQRGFVDFKSANKIAVKKTLNIVAAMTRRGAVKNVKDDFTLRNTFTVRNIQFDKVETNTISKMRSRTGATQRADYLETQHTGGTRRKKRPGRTAIAAKGARISGSKARPVSRKNYISKIAPRTVRGSQKRRFRSHKGYAVAQMFVAYNKNKYLKRRGSIYRVRSISGGSGKPVRARLEHLYVITPKTIFIKRVNWLESATRRPARDLGNIHKSQLRKLWKNGKII